MVRLSLIVAILFLLFVIGLEFNDNQRFRGGTPVAEYVPSPVLVENKEYAIDAIRIRTNPNYFEIQLQDVGWIRAYLAKEYREQAKLPLVDLFHSAENPIVLLRKNCDAYWVVDVVLTADGEKINLFDWLSDRGLLFQ